MIRRLFHVSVFCPRLQRRPPLLHAPYIFRQAPMPRRSGPSVSILPIFAPLTPTLVPKLVFEGTSRSYFRSDFQRRVGSKIKIHTPLSNFLGKKGLPLELHLPYPIRVIVSDPILGSFVSYSRPNFGKTPRPSPAMLTALRNMMDFGELTSIVGEAHYSLNLLLLPHMSSAELCLFPPTLALYPSSFDNVILLDMLTARASWPSPRLLPRSASPQWCSRRVRPHAFPHLSYRLDRGHVCALLFFSISFLERASRFCGPPVRFPHRPRFLI